jgi:hypothetical protein
MVEPARRETPVPPGITPQPVPGHTRIYRPVPADTEAVSEEDASELDLARAPFSLVVDGERHELGDRTLTLGRSRECDIRVDDPNVSRRHAEIRHEDGAYSIVDLGSTNGLVVDGKRVDRARLEPGTAVLLGTTELRLERGS